MKARLYTKLLKKKVRLRSAGPIDADAGRVGVVVNVYLWRGEVHYTVMLKDGRLREFSGAEIVVE